MEFQFSPRIESRYRALCVSKIKVFRKHFREQSLLSNAENNFLPQLQDSRRTFAENTISNMPKVKITKFLRGDRIPCFISISKFRLKDPFTTISNLPELGPRHNGSILLLQMKEVISINNGSS